MPWAAVAETGRLRHLPVVRCTGLFGIATLQINGRLRGWRSATVRLTRQVQSSSAAWLTVRYGAGLLASGSSTIVVPFIFGPSWVTVPRRLPLFNLVTLFIVRPTVQTVASLFTHRGIGVGTSPIVGDIGTETNGRKRVPCDDDSSSDAQLPNSASLDTQDIEEENLRHEEEIPRSGQSDTMDIEQESRNTQGSELKTQLEPKVTTLNDEEEGGTTSEDKDDGVANPVPSAPAMMKPLFTQIFNPIGMAVQPNLTGVEVTNAPANAVIEVTQPTNSRTKRRRKNQTKDISQFLDLEAEVSSVDEDDEDDEDDIGDFINDKASDTDDDIEESDGHQDEDPSTMSHRAIAHMMTMEEANLVRDNFFQHKKKQDSGTDEDSGTDQDSGTDNGTDGEEDTVETSSYAIHDYPDPPQSVPESLLHLLPPPEVDHHLWRVSVKRGQEEILTFTLYRKLKAGSFQVSSVVGRVSCPGWIYVEANTLGDVQQLIEGVADIYQQKIIAVPPQDHALVLRETPFTYPAPGSWVRVEERGLYYRDLAWVANRGCGMLCDLFVVPRVDLYPQKRKRKAPKGQRAKEKQKEKERRVPKTRIPQQRLDASLLEALGFEVTRQSVMPHIEEHPAHWARPQAKVPPILAPFHDEDNRPIATEFLFRGLRYSDGYAILTTTQHKPAIPTRAELNMFKDSMIIPPKDFLAMEEKLDALRLQVGDPVKITGGEGAGALGDIVGLRLDSSESTHRTSTAIVETSEGIQVEVAFEDIRKVLAVGDSVLVVDGVHQGFTGWIVCIEGANVNLFDDATGEGVCVAGHQVAFYVPPKMKYKQTQADTSQAPPDFHFSKMTA
ncbi:hypothetical protein H0H92_002804, partial [Tricholoma furcatifolium]